MSYEMKKRVIGLKNPTFQARKENTDDVGVDQASDLRFAFAQLLLRAHMIPLFGPNSRYQEIDDKRGNHKRGYCDEVLRVIDA
jgi:hypothetical protein